MILVAGEALIDMVADQRGEQQYTASAGGAAYNVACALGLLGTESGFVCPISTDVFGDLLLDKLHKSSSTLILGKRVTAPTPMAIVDIDKANQPHYSFYRQGTADRMLSLFDMENIAPVNTKILHITGFCLNEATDYDQWMMLVKSVKSLGGIISVDPNVRANLVSNKEDYCSRIKALIKIADIVKLSDEDLMFLYSGIELEEAKKALATSVNLAIITLGSKGAEAFYQFGKKTIRVEAQTIEKIVDTVGAGDCFSAAYLYQLFALGFQKPEQLNAISSSQLSTVLTFAAASAAINCTRKGCQPPSFSEIENSTRNI